MGALDTIKNIFSAKKGNKSIITSAGNFDFQRQRQDILSWREAIIEAERQIYPFRHKMINLMHDTALNGHVTACVERRINLSKLREYRVFNKDGSENMDLLFKLRNSLWFYDYMHYVLESKLYGYSLIVLGDIINGELSGVTSIKRQNVNPDLNIVTNIPTSTQGTDFLNGNLSNWAIYCATSSDNGMSKCGYGLFYKVAPYEIMLRNILGYNGDYIQLFAAPFRWLKTAKTSDNEKKELANMLTNMGSAGWGIGDKTDELQFVEGNSYGGGWQGYADFEKRCEQKISKILLGHSDVLDSVTGQLGSTHTESPSYKALMDIQMIDGVYLLHYVNKILFPKLVALGLKEYSDIYIEFNNDENIKSWEERVNKDNNLVADTLAKLAASGFEVNSEWVAERMGIDQKYITKIEITKKDVQPIPSDNKKAGKKKQKPTD